MGWAKKHDHCVNCRTIRHRHKGKGFCAKCYVVARRLEKARNWDIFKPETLIDCPRDYQHVVPRVFQRIKDGFIRQLESRLQVIKFRESQLSEPVDAITIEYQLGRLAAAARVKNKDMFHGLAGYIEMVFGPDQRHALYALLHKIEEDMRWKGVNYYTIFKSTDES